MSILDAAGSVLLVHAHPDDETITTGALIAELVSRGSHVALLTGTRGERGEAVAGRPGIDGAEALSAEREREVQRAADTLGIADRSWLGEPPARSPALAARRYLDSGMTWVRPGLAGPAADVEADSLVSAPLEEVTEDIRTLIAVLRPDLVISYDEAGGYGHPDHLRIREAALAATRAERIAFAEIVLSPAPDAEWFPLETRFDTVSAALRCHASQLTVDGAHIVHSGGQREPITTSIGLRIV